MYIFKNLSFDFLNSGVFRTEASHLSTSSRCINILLLKAYTDFQSGRTAVIARHVSFAHITCVKLCTTTVCIIADDTRSRNLHHSDQNFDKKFKDLISYSRHITAVFYNVKIGTFATFLGSALERYHQPLLHLETTSR